MRAGYSLAAEQAGGTPPADAAVEAQRVRLLVALLRTFAESRSPEDIARGAAYLLRDNYDTSLLLARCDPQGVLRALPDDFPMEDILVPWLLRVARRLEIANRQSRLHASLLTQREVLASIQLSALQTPCVLITSVPSTVCVVCRAPIRTPVCSAMSVTGDVAHTRCAGALVRGAKD
jgi:hypothetical protein